MPQESWTMKQLKPPFLSVFQIGLSIHSLNKRSEKKMGLSLVQWCLLEQLIDMPGTSAHDLSKAVGVHPSTLTQTLKRLEKKGYVFTNVDPKDSRKKQVALTKAGKRILESVRTQMDDWSIRLRGVGEDLERVKLVLQIP